MRCVLMRGIKMWRWWGWLSGYLGLARMVEGDWWEPGPGVNWDWRLSGTPKSTAGVDVYDIDLFDVAQSDMLSLSNAGILVICYFSAGTYEEYRDDEDEFPRSSLGFPKADSEGEWWLNINDEGVKAVMKSRLDLAAEKGCDGVEPDAVEVYAYGENVSGWDISADDQLLYNKWIADQAHARNLSVGLKNDELQLTELQPWFDWALSTDCYSEGTCGLYDPFVSAGKAVLNAEFAVVDLSLCNETEAESIDFIVKGYDLDERRCSCGFPETNVDCETLLIANSPTASPTSVADDDEDTSEEGSEDEAGTPTWVIVTAIAMVVLILMMAYGAVVYRRRKHIKGGARGVDDFM